MEASVDISYYPLSENYRSIIIDFVGQVRQNYPSLRIESNGLSTQLFGEYDVIMGVFQNEVKQFLKANKSVFIVKLAAGKRTPESIPNELKQDNE